MFMTRLVGLVWLAAAGQPASLRAQADTSTSSIRLELNLAAMRVDLFRNDSLLGRFPVAIGQPDFPTPVGSFLISSVEWNPWWIPPASEWARGEVPRRPGPNNPMGRVKLNFRPLYFLHGTPDEKSIGRASSHGCVRLRNVDAIGLAITVMQAGITAPDTAQMTLIAADTTMTSTWLLEQPVPITIGSHPVVIERDTLYLYPEPYLRPAPPVAPQVLDALRSRLPLVPDSAAIAAFVAKAAGAPQKIPVRDLLRVVP